MDIREEGGIMYINFANHFVWGDINVTYSSNICIFAILDINRFF